MKLDTFLTNLKLYNFFLLMIANVLEMNRVAAAAGSQSNHFCYWHVDDS